MPSLFPNIPPTINFITENEKGMFSIMLKALTYGSNEILFMKRVTLISGIRGK
jgi:hypothetical protein